MTDKNSHKPNPQKSGGKSREEGGEEVGAGEEARDGRYWALRERILGDLMREGGVGYGTVSKEVLYLLPRQFVEAYIKLFWEALAEQGKGTAIDEASGSIQKPDSKLRGGVGGLGMGGGAGKKYKNAWLLRSEKALKLKETIDRDLLRLAAEVMAGRGGGGGSGGEGRGGSGKSGGLGVGQVGRCPGKGCGRFVNGKMRFCSWCGTKLTLTVRK